MCRPTGFSLQRIALPAICCSVCLMLAASSFAAQPERQERSLKKPSATKTAPAKPQPQPQPQKEQPAIAPVPTTESKPLEPTTASPVNPEMPTASVPATGETLNWFVFSSVAPDASTSSYALHATLGQIAAGGSAAPSYALSQGFWYTASEPASCCVGTRGDANGNGVINVVDLNFLVAFFFLGGAPSPCPEETDANGNGTINVVDLNYLVAYFFLGGSPPAPCP